MTRATWRAVVVLACGVVFGLGCSDELDPTQPEDAYEVFKASLMSGDAEGVWARVDEDTQTFYQERRDKLEAMGNRIEEFLPQADHRLAREQAGVVLTDEIADGKALFLKVFTPGELPNDQAHQLGMDIDELNVAEDGLLAEVKTRGGQVFYLSRKSEEGEWFVMLLKSTDQVAGSMKWLDANEEALEQTIKDLIDERREAREQIIAELMGL